ncbi:MAG: hypothetical protein FWG38_10255 [Defluviitaleaceae bacterium]|nr:hypothetical protein [Defluviitaleaceae bacterium]
MQKLIQVLTSGHGDRTIENPEIKALLEDGWRIVDLHSTSAGTGGSNDAAGDIMFSMFVILEK